MNREKERVEFLKKLYVAAIINDSGFVCDTIFFA